jgi:hypothetical protein
VVDQVFASFHREAIAMSDDLDQQLDAARDRLDRDVELLSQALDLRELLEWCIDLDDAVSAVAEFKYVSKAHRRRRQ